MEGVFFENDREGVEGFGSDTNGLEIHAPGGRLGCAGVRTACLSLSRAGFNTGSAAVGAGVERSGGSDDGGSELGAGFDGVLNGDLNGLWSVFVASFSRRRLACGVDILTFAVALDISG